MTSKEKIVSAEKHKKRAVEAAKRNNFLDASFNIALALRLYGEASNSNGIREAKRLTVEYNKKAEEQMQTFEYAVEIDQETKDQLEALIKELTKASTLKANLERIVKSRVLVPRFATAVKNAKEIVPLTAQITTHFSIGEEGHLASLDNFDNEWLAYHYRNQLKITMGILDESISRLISSQQFTEKSIMEVVINRRLLNANSLLKLQTVLERRFTNDYLSALHLLIPLVEKTFMSLSGKVGLDTIAYSGKTISTRNATLSSAILKSTEYQEGWGSDFCIMLNFFLLDADGYKFRHRIAHGDITVDECNMTSFNLAFYFFIRIVMMVEARSK